MWGNMHESVPDRCTPELQVCVRTYGKHSCLVGHDLGERIKELCKWKG